MNESARDFWEKTASRYDRVTKSLLGRPLPRAVELTAGAVAGAGNVLEVAAGTGLLTAAIAPRVGRVVATDLADNMLANLRERMKRAGITNVETARRDICALGYPPASFDIVVAGNVLHLVPDLDRALDALTYVLRPGGRLVAPTFIHDETLRSKVLSRVFGAFMVMHRRFTAASLRGALERHGLRVVSAETIRGPIPIAFVEAVLLPVERS
jgi:phosphatidylethanolamine/phosphatidyl-N-methylethanolamine N-methyltransferase